MNIIFSIQVGIWRPVGCCQLIQDKYRSLIGNDVGKLLESSKVYQVFLNRYSIYTMLLILAHQSVVAFSAVFLTRAIENFQSGSDYSGSLLLYFVSMIFPYLPGYLSFVTLKMWVVRSHNEYIDILVDFLRGKGNVFRNRRMRAAAESAAARSSFIIINDTVSFAHSFTSFVLNSFLSFLVIGLILPGDIFYGYIVSVALCAVLIMLTRRVMVNAATESERSFVDYTDVLSNIWPNVALNNKINRQAWRDGFERRSVIYYRKKVTLEVKRQVVNCLLAMLAMLALLPTVFLLWVAINGQASAAVIAVIMVNLTRIFHILGSLSALVSQSLDWSTEWARVKVLFYLFDMPSNTQEAAAAKEMTINGLPLEDFDGFVRKVAAEKCGRYTIRGDNGSGKTTLLLELKNRLGEKSVYLPPGESGLFWPNAIHEGSTGEQVLHCLHSLVENKEATHLLLDEWDANLDKVNMAFFDGIFAEQSKIRVIVEVRH